MLTKEDILKASDIKTKVVHVKEWGGDVTVKMLTASERDEWEESTIKTEGEEVKVDRQNMRAKLLCFCLVDESGNRLFTLDEAIALGKKSSPAIEKAYNAAAKLNGMRPEDLDELEKN